MAQAKAFFAWVDSPAVVFDPVLHARLDLNITSLELSHAEGEYARLSVTCENPGIGLLAPGRQQYALMSVSVDGGTPELMFRGIVNSMPTNLVERQISLEFLAQPDKQDDILEAYAKSIAVAPYYDALVSGSDFRDPSIALLARSATFYIDPVTHEHSLNDMLDWERLVTIGPWHQRSSFSLTQLKPPLARCTMNFVAEWTQTARGTCDIAEQVNYAGGGNGVRSLTNLDELARNYEIVDPNGSSGWSVSNVEHNGIPSSPTTQKFRTGPAQLILLIKPAGKTSDGDTIWHTWIDTAYEVYPLGQHFFQATKFEMVYSYSQERREVLQVTLEADIQDLVMFGFREETLDDIGLDSLYSDPSHPWMEQEDYVVGDRVIRQDKVYVCQEPYNSGYGPFNRVLPQFEAIPLDQRKPEMYRWLRVRKQAALTDIRSPTFFTTDRGRGFTAYAVNRVRAYLRQRMRSLEATVVNVEWSRAYDITLKDALLIESEYFPGNSAVGKIVAYTKRWNGETQTFAVNATLGIAAGLGYVPIPPASNGSGYTAAWASYSYPDDAVIETVTQDVKWILSGEKVRGTCNPYKLDDPAYACESVSFEMTAGQQLAIASRAQAMGRSPIKAVSANPTVFRLRMKTIDGTDMITRKLTATGSKVQGPRGIDLEYAG